MTAINELIRFCYDRGWSQTLYLSVVLVNYLIQIVFLLIYRKKYDLSVGKILLAQLFIYPVAYLWMLVLAWVENGFTNWGANNIVRLFVYVPLINLLAAKLTKIPVNKLNDISAPCYAFDQAFGHIVCPLVGCCCGYPSSWGVWNPTTNDIRFPNQWLECLVALCIWFFLLGYAKKKSYKADGSCYALFLVLFGVTRFFLEFLRDNNKLFLGISNLALHALFMVVVGTIWLFFLAEKEKESKRKAEITQRKPRIYSPQGARVGYPKEDKV